MLVFGRFTDLRGEVDTVLSENGSTFCAAAKLFVSLLCFIDFRTPFADAILIELRFPISTLTGI